MHGSRKVTKTEMHVIYWKNKAKYMSYSEKNQHLPQKITG